MVKLRLPIFFQKKYNIVKVSAFLLTEHLNPNNSETKFVTMKHLAPYALMLLLLITTSTVFSQTNKPKQFSNYPDVINCTVAELNKAFTSSTGQAVDLSFSNNFNFTGAVISNLSTYGNLQSAIIKSPAFNNTIFCISKRINSDNTVTYIGHIMNRNYFDGYELKKNALGNYQLIKTETDKILQECKQN